MMFDEMAATKGDEFHELRINDRVRAVDTVKDGDLIIAEEGDTGTIVAKEVGCYPTIFWPRTRRYGDAIPGAEFKLDL